MCPLRQGQRQRRFSYGETVVSRAQKERFPSEEPQSRTYSEQVQLRDLEGSYQEGMSREETPQAVATRLVLVHNLKNKITYTHLIPCMMDFWFWTPARRKKLTIIILQYPLFFFGGGGGGVCLVLLIQFLSSLIADLSSLIIH